MLRSRSQEDRDTYKSKRNRHVAFMLKVKEEFWITYVHQQSTTSQNKWGKLTKWLIHGKKELSLPTVLEKSDNTYTTGIQDTIEYLMNELIPNSPDDLAPPIIHRHNSPRGLKISYNDLKTIVWRQKNRAPGADGITIKVIKAAWPVIDTRLLELINGCLKNGTFPFCWKHAEVVILLKNKDKDPLKAKSYRPVSLLPVLGQILEETVCDLLELDSGSKLSPNQHGFRPQKSTKTALAEVAEWSDNNGKHVLGCFLDISGAFDNVKWSQLATDMTALGCKQSLVDLAINYLSYRTATYKIGSVQHTIKLTRGCPQGSKFGFGPRLWNITMDPLLKAMTLHDPDSTHVVAYADDIVLLVAGNTRRQVIRSTERALEIINSWANVRGLAFSKEKSVMVPLKGGLVPGFTARFGDSTITSVEHTKYLGLTLQSNFYFDLHAINLLESSTDMFSRLKSIRKSKWWTSPELATMIYKAVYIPRVTYGATTWFNRLRNKEDIKKKLTSAQRRTLLAITGAYKTSSTHALQVITGTPPIVQHIQYKIDIENGTTPEEAKTKCLDEWQTLWNNSSKGRWTFSFLPSIRQRLVTPITFDHYTCQIITGHGDFNYKLHGFNLVDNPTCSCGHTIEDARHILEDCTKANQHRVRLRRTMELSGASWPYENTEYIKNRKSWEALTIFATCYLKDKEKERLERG